MPSTQKPFGWAIPSAPGAYLFTQDAARAALHGDSSVPLYTDGNGRGLDLATINQMAERFTSNGLSDFSPANARAASLAIKSFVMWLWLTQMPEEQSS